MVDIVLHVGAPKCGSNAIQTALTNAPVIEKDDGTSLAYGVIDGSGSFACGARLRPPRNVQGYHASANANRMKAFDKKQLAAIGRQLEKVDAESVVLSCEGWLRQTSLFKRVLSAWRKPVRVIAYVRPQASYLNAAWWQWGAWQDIGLDACIAERLPHSLWSLPLRAWRDNPFVAELSIRLLPDDVVGDFLHAVGVTRNRPVDDKVNTGLPAPILRLFQRNRALRPSKKSSEIDFVLARRVAYGGSAPWVLSREMIEDIISKARSSNEDLLQLLSPDAAESMRRDPRWWDADAFANETLEPWEPQPAKAEELERLCVAMAEAIVGMERRSLGLV